MPKRAKSPEFFKDSDLFVVFQPWPLSPIWEIKNDSPREFCRWIAHIIGSDKVLAMHHMPKAPNAVLLEVQTGNWNKEFLLGRHEWSTMLKKPDARQMDCRSSIFHSCYSTFRAAEKAGKSSLSSMTCTSANKHPVVSGWKRVSAEDDWFDEPTDTTFARPYPIPTWCDVPEVDPTRKKLARPIAQSIKPAPLKKEPKIVPGSEGYLQAKAKQDGGVPAPRNVVPGSARPQAQMTKGARANIKPSQTNKIPQAASSSPANVVPNPRGAWDAGPAHATTVGDAWNDTRPKDMFPSMTPAARPARAPPGPWGKRPPMATPPVTTDAPSVPPGLPTPVTWKTVNPPNQCKAAAPSPSGAGARDNDADNLVGRMNKLDLDMPRVSSSSSSDSYDSPSVPHIIAASSIDDMDEENEWEGNYVLPGGGDITKKEADNPAPVNEFSDLLFLPQAKTDDIGCEIHGVGNKLCKPGICMGHPKNRRKGKGAKRTQGVAGGAGNRGRGRADRGGSAQACK
ncbi:hypothetical protein FISHEDRAFT_56613 [Fistulina hepatica ATCC 64428]|uniref:Uncharacterized protein n=1 Tax=Fistulina hepatica ATCC 64428 TaxID=1128425 RepID=A0A0D7AHV9_9AGAR|nr:hypothetical protein FISHEDRAFT_56613 [Fistulina hepatica ATCC 64428]